MNIINGLIAIRTFRTDDRGCLLSVAMETNWNGNTIWADNKPTINNNCGIHSYLPEKYVFENSDNFGIVELDGKIIEHANGVLRAERCRVLKLYFLAKKYNQDTINIIGLIYQVPMVLTNSLKESYKTWMKDNKELIKRNDDILKQSPSVKDMINVQISQERYKIPKRKNNDNDCSFNVSFIANPYISWHTPETEGNEEEVQI